MEDPSTILSLGFMWICPEDLANKVSQYSESEQKRHERIDQVAEKVGPTCLYSFKNINNLGI